MWGEVSNTLKKFGICRFSESHSGQILSQNARVDRQAGERVGAGNGVRLESLRPENPTAQRLFGFGIRWNYGAVNHPMVPVYGAEKAKIGGRPPYFTVPGQVPEP